MQVDASDVGIGNFCLRNLILQRNYDIGNSELLVIKTTLEEWRHWLELGAAVIPGVDGSLEFRVPADSEIPQLPPGQVRCRFNFHLFYRPGSKNLKPDALSRMYCPDPIPKPPDYVLPRACVLGVVQWEVEEQVLQVQNQEPTLGSCLPNHL